MTQETFPEGWGPRLIEIIKIAGAIAASIVGVAGLLAYLFYARDWMEAREQESLRLDKLVETYDELHDDLEETYDELHQELVGVRAQMSSQAITIAQLTRNVDLATRPRLIFELNLANSKPRGAGCYEYRTCTIDIRIRRTVEGAHCVLVPNSDRYFFVEAGSGARIQVTKLSGTPMTNVGREWFDYHWSFEVPSSLIEPVGFMYAFTYKHCRGPEDEAEVTQESPVIPIALLREGPAGVTVTTPSEDADPPIE